MADDETSSEQVVRHQAMDDKLTQTENADQDSTTFSFENKCK